MRVFLLLLLIIGLGACGHNGSTPGQKLDTLLQKADRLGDTLKEQAKASWDSTKAGARDLGDRVERSFERRKDSVAVDTFRN